MAQRRLIAAAAGFTLLCIAYTKTPDPSPTYHSASRPGQLDLSFWVNRHGMEQFDVRGEIGFGDMARILLRRRANGPMIRPLRDRFMFQTTDFKKLQVPDVFRAKYSEHRLNWISKPERFVAGAGRIINIPLVIENDGAATAPVEAEISGTPNSGFSTTIEAGTTKGYFLSNTELVPGVHSRQLVIKCGGSVIAVGITFEIRPLVKLHVRLLDERSRGTSARVYLTGSDGLAYAPKGAISRIAAMPAEYYFYAREQFDVELPTGPVELEATRGLEYKLAHRQV